MGDSVSESLPKSPFRWSKDKERAASLLAQDRLTDDEIAAEVGVTRQAVYKWKKHPEFSARIAELVDAYRKQIRARGIAVVENRIAHLQRRHDLLNQVVAERGSDPGMQAVPGGKTGLMVHNVKAVGSGEFAERVDLYEVDTGLLSELRAIEKQTAQELGQWEEKQATSQTGQVVVKVLRGVSMDDL